MKSGKQFLGLIVAVLVLGALSGVLYWSNRHPAKNPVAPSLQGGPVVMKVNPAKVTAIAITPKDAPPIELAKQTNGTWQITAPEKLRADGSTVVEMLENIAPLHAHSVVENNARDLKRFGLQDPTLQVTITSQGGTTQKLLFGDNTPIGGNVYLMLAGAPRVFAASEELKSELGQSVLELRDKRLISIPADQMTGIELTHAGQTTVLARAGSTWALKKPAPYRTDTIAADSLASALGNAVMDASQPGQKQAASAFTHGTPVASVKVTGPKGEQQTLEIRKDHGTDYAKSSCVSGVYQVDSYLADAMAKTVNDLRNKQLFAFGDSDPDSIDIQATNPKESGAELRNTQGWWRDGKKMDLAKVESLVSALRELSAVTFASNGFTKPMLTITVKSNGGNRVEKVEIAKNLSQYYARRGNDPSLYLLDGGAVEGIESAAAAIQ